MTPQHAKSFMAALQDNIGKYEKQFGEIKIHGNQKGMQNQMGFAQPQDGEQGKS